MPKSIHFKSSHALTARSQPRRGFEGIPAVGMRANQLADLTAIKLQAVKSRFRKTIRIKEWRNRQRALVSPRIKLVSKKKCLQFEFSIYARARAQRTKYFNEVKTHFPMRMFAYGIALRANSFSTRV